MRIKYKGSIVGNIDNNGFGVLSQKCWWKSKKNVGDKTPASPAFLGVW